MKKNNTSKQSRTDWRRLRSGNDQEIDRGEIPELKPADFARGVVRHGLRVAPTKQQITLRVDSDVLSWFRRQGRGYQTQINALLRAYMEAHKE